MKYFIDTEFIEGFSKWTFAKNRHFVDLISIGIIAEDGQTYYAISNEYNYNDADDWVKENVLLPMYIDTVHGDARYSFNAKNFHKHFGKSNKQIAQEVFQFCTNDSLTIEKAKYYNVVKEGVEFYGYYSDYDWVVFCSLFGRMIDLPKGFPMYCKDLKQMLDEKIEKLNWQYGRDIWSNSRRSINTISKGDTQEKDRPATFDEKLKTLKELQEYPKQENEHNALADAKWNYELYKFLQTLLKNLQ